MLSYPPPTTRSHSARAPRVVRLPLFKVALRCAVKTLACAAALAITISTAILAKERVAAPPLVSLRMERSLPNDLASLGGAPALARPIPVGIASPEPIAPAPAAPELDKPSKLAAKAYPAGTRFFDGRPVRPARTIYMTVTAYSPDERSCGVHADGQTATLHSVFTNNMRLVAADTRILPFGSMVSIPGYDRGRVVPVLDRGGAIKGHRLDLLFPTHEEARRWGVKRVPVIVWEYADGKPAPDPRKRR